jgi:hypothetical protein
MFGIEDSNDSEGQSQDPKSQVLQEILEFAQEKMLGKMKGKNPDAMEVSIESTDSPEGMEAEEAKDGTGPELCPHCKQPMGGSKSC